MSFKYKDEKDIADLVRSFEKASVSRDDWKHAQHLIVGLHYLTVHDFDTATEKMRTGIFNLLTRGFGIDLSKEMPYNETLTIFWMRTISGFNASTNGAAFIEKAQNLVSEFDKDYPLRFYSREYLFSDAARAAFVEPDLEPIDSQNE